MRWLRGLAVVACLGLLGAAPAKVDWGRAAVEDLTAMHDIVRDNHPGPVDPLDPGFNDWLGQGERKLMAQARAARSEHDYQLVLRDYANGFGDGHLNVAMNDAQTHVWPGFLVRADAMGAPLLVALLDDGPAGLALGDELLSCGGVPAREMLQERVLRPLLNPHVPQRLMLKSGWLMVVDADDRKSQAASCVFEIAGRDEVVGLRWRPIDGAALTAALQKSSGIEIPAIGVRQIGDVWLISLPTFDPEGAQVGQLQALTAFLQSHAAMLHAARHVVIDLRGNDGGDDDWGDGVLGALWGDDAVNAVEGSEGATVDWRVSARNEAALRGNAARAGADAQPDAVAYYDGLAARMAGALAAGEVFMPESYPAAGVMPKLTSPFAHPVYVLTTPHCASACLDFLDTANEFPGVVRIGLETSADTDYLDTAAAVLPSGHATLHYAMKVFRGRKRAANAAYEPQIMWPGGVMGDASVAAWVAALP
jgi:hypothetical protein